MKDKKRGFWLLLLIFGFLAIFSLAVNWAVTEPGDPEIGMSMGGMMNRHHLGQLTPQQLLASEIEPHAVSIATDQPVSPLIAAMGFISTLIVFLALPLMLGGAVMLAILWY